MYRMQWIALKAGALGLGALLAAGCEQPQNTVRGTPGALPGRGQPDAGAVEAEQASPRINATTYFAHGHLLEREGNYERAIVQYQEALKLMPEFFNARNRLGITLNKLGRHGEASAEFRRTVASKPDQAYLHNNLGFSLYLEGKFAESEAALRRALELKPTFTRGRMNLALALAKLGRYAEAFESFKQVGSEADAHYNIAVVQTEAGQYADAARSLDAALALDPKMDAARAQLREVAFLSAKHGEGQPAPQSSDIAAAALAFDDVAASQAQRTPQRGTVAGGATAPLPSVTQPTAAASNPTEQTATASATTPRATPNFTEAPTAMPIGGQAPSATQSQAQTQLPQMMPLTPIEPSSPAAGATTILSTPTTVEQSSFATTLETTTSEPTQPITTGNAVRQPEKATGNSGKSTQTGTVLARHDAALSGTNGATANAAATNGATTNVTATSGATNKGTTPNASRSTSAMPAPSNGATPTSGILQMQPLTPISGASIPPKADSGAKASPAPTTRPAAGFDGVMQPIAPK